MRRRIIAFLLVFTSLGAVAESASTVQGSTVKAGNDVTLQADDQINLLAARNTADQHSTNKSSSASVGVSFGTGGFGVTASASKGRGNADGSDVNWTNARVEAGNQVAMTSGSDTTLKGAVVAAPQITANVGGNLNIESLQDTSRYNGKQQSLGGSITVGAGVGGSFSAGKSNIDSNYASVAGQSGIKAGDEGFNVSVKGNTDLKGAVIAGTQAAVDQDKNRFQTGGVLTASDIQNQASYSAKSAGINIGSSVSLDGKLAPGGASAGIGRDSGNAGSSTKAGISGIAGNKDARTGDVETGIGKIFDADKVQKDINAQTQITQMFGQHASQAIGDYGKRQLAQAEQQQTEGQRKQQQADAARREGRSEEAATLQTQADTALAQAQTLRDQWGENGTSRLLAHTLIGGLTGGLSGAAGAATGTLTAPEVAKVLANAGIDPALNQTLTALASTTIGATVGGATGGNAGATAGGSAAFNEVTNNYLTSTQELQRDKDLAQCKTLACTASVKLRYAAIDAKQEVGLIVGVGGGIGYQTVEQASAVVEMVKNLPETLTALKSIVSDPEFRAKVGDQIADDYKQRIDMQTRAYNDGGWDGSITAGVEAGRLAVDIVTAGTAAVGAGKLIAMTAKAGATVVGEVGTLARSLSTAGKSSISEFIPASGKTTTVIQADGMFATQGLSIDPMRFPDGVKMVRELEKSGLSTQAAIDTAESFIRSGSTPPIAAPLDITDKLVKVVPAGGQPSASTGYWMRETELAVLRQDPANLANKLGLPPGMQAAQFDVYQIAPHQGAVVFESTIAPTTVNGIPSTIGGARQTIVLDRNQFTLPAKVGSIKAK